MRRLLGVLPLALLAVTALQAQSYITLSADTSYATGSPEEIHKAEVTVTNNGPEGQNMTWIRLVNDKPEEWETSVCDPNLCWAPFADAPGYGWFQDAGAEDEFYVQFDGRNFPDGPAIEGHGEVEIIIYSEDDSANYNARGVFIADLGGEVGFHSPDMDNQYEVYPNPAVNDLHIMTSYTNGVEQVQIVNLVGKVMLVQQWSKGTGKLVLDISNLPEGIYFVQFIGKDQVLKTKKISITR